MCVLCRGHDSYGDIMSDVDRVWFCVAKSLLITFRNRSVNVVVGGHWQWVQLHFSVTGLSDPDVITEHRSITQLLKMNYEVVE